MSDVNEQGGAIPIEPEARAILKELSSNPAVLAREIARLRRVVRDLQFEVSRLQSLQHVIVPSTPPIVPPRPVPGRPPDFTFGHPS